MQKLKIKKERIFKRVWKATIDKEDITLLEDISIVDLLNNLKNRYEKKHIFSNIGNELIVVNPYEYFNDLFAVAKMNEFIDVLLIVFIPLF